MTAVHLWRAADLVWLAVAVLGGMFAAGVAVGLSGVDDMDRVLLTLAASGAVMGGAAGVLLVARADRAAAVGLRRCRPRDALAGAGLALALLPVLGGLSYLLQWALGYEAHPQAELLMLDRMDAARLAITAALAVAVVPFAEELVFRGVLLSALLERGPAEGHRTRAIVISSVLFGLVHLDPVVVVPTALLGAVAAELRLRSGSLWPALTLHATNNAVAVALMAGGAVT